MSEKVLWVIAVLMTVVLTAGSPVAAADAGSGDIDTFIAESLDELLEAEDISEIVRIRSEIVARKRAAASADFIRSAKKYLGDAFDEVQGWESDKLKKHIQLNLLVLTAQLESADLAEFGIKMADDKNSMIRYWAVKSMANPGIASQLNSQGGQSAGYRKNILTSLGRAVENESCPEILELIVKFAAQLSGRDATELMVKTADVRIAEYEQWTVQYELMDMVLLKSLGKKIITEQSLLEKAELSRKFAQLYSYVMQRYVLGGEMLSDLSRQQLASVLVEIEQTMVGELLGRQQSTIINAVQKRDAATLESEFESLLGGSVRVGKLGRQLNFDYGKDADDRPITAPKKLSLPPGEKD